MSKLPPELFKYCDERGLDILQNVRLKVSRPNAFNDPFEFSPRIVGAPKMSKARKQVKDKRMMEGLYKEAKAKGIFLGGFRDFRAEYKRNLEQHARSVFR